MSLGTEDARTNGDASTDDAGPEPVGEPEYEPPRIAAGAAVAGALFATLALASSAMAALAPAGLGAGVVVLGVVRGSDRTALAGCGLVFAGVLLAGAEGARPPGLLLGAVGTVIAYDASQYAIRLGHQLRANAPTREAELVHVGATSTVVAATAGVGALTFRIGTGGQPSTALVALLLATVLLVWALLR